MRLQTHVQDNIAKSDSLKGYFRLIENDNIE